MRMWNISPKKMCRQHLLGEHAEMHMFSGTLKKGISVNGYIEKGLVNLSKIKKRHDELSQEMVLRNYNHNSPMHSNPKFSGFSGKVNAKENLKALAKRCKFCRKLIYN